MRSSNAWWYISLILVLPVACGFAQTDQETVVLPGGWIDSTPLKGVAPFGYDLLEPSKLFRHRIHKQKMAEYDPNKTGEGEVYLDQNVGDFYPAAVSIGRNFGGPAPNEWIPPDPTLASGPNHVIAANNDDFSIYTKNGALVAGPIDANTWFQSQDFLFDPIVAYDPWYGRYLILYSRRGSNTSSWAVAISKTGTPTADRNDWWFYFFNARLDGTTDVSQWPDYPRLGFSRHILALQGNMFSFGGGFLRSKVRLLNKQQIYNGQTATWYDILIPGETSAQPVRMYSEPTGTEVFFIATTVAGGGNTLRIRRVLNPSRYWQNGTAPTIESENKTVSTYAVPPDGRQPGTSTRIDNLDCRLMNATYYRGLLATTHATAYNWNDGTGNRAAMKLYLVEVSASSPALIRRERIFGAPRMDYVYPAVMVNVDGDMVFTAGRSSDNPATFAQVVVSGWALNSTVPDDSMVLKAGGNSYTGGRWGDYFSVDLDPNDKRTTWVIGEYAGGGNWGTWIGEVRYPRLEGDVNRDGCVNDVDLAALIFAFGQSGVGLLEDLNGDNIVDDSDLSLVVFNFGDGC